MEILRHEEYYKLNEPIKQVTLNNLFARSVVEHKITGKIYVDNCENPGTFYVVHPYGMSLLFGNNHNETFNHSFRDYGLNINRSRNKFEWMQVFPDQWNHVLKALFSSCLIKSAENTTRRETGIIELNTRVNFKFDLVKYLNFRKTCPFPELKIVRTDRQIFDAMKGSVVPKYFWESADDFLENGVGYSLFIEGKLASTAYSAFIHDSKLELGIETFEKFRGKGYAAFACSALIDYCLEKKYEPVWSCRLENTSSYKLAQKIGFVPLTLIPYYRLSK